MTIDELKSYDGRNNRRAYIAYKDVVYDVTQSSLWQEGEHQGMHSAGVDLTSALSGAPHGDEVFKEFPVVATLQREESTTKKEPLPPQDFKTDLRIFYKKYHPHPITVHFPIALHLFAAGFDIAFLNTFKEIYAVLVFYALFIATVMGFVAMLPGVLSWWINYNLSTQRPFVVKLIVATITLILGVIAIEIYLQDPNVIYSYTTPSIIYHAIILLTGLNVIILGYYGGKISWGNLGEEKMQTVSFDMNEPNIMMSSGSTEQESPRLFSAPASSVKIASDERNLADNAHQVSISILIGGAAGLGIDTLEKILSNAFKASGYYVYSTKEFMSRVRGGSNTTLLRIANFPVQAPCWEVDISVAMDALALEHMKERWHHDTLILADESFSGDNSNVIAIAMKESAKKFGNAQYGNTYIAGLLFGILGLEKSFLLQSIDKHFKGEGSNKEVAELGFQTGTEIENLTLPKLPNTDIKAVEKLHLMDGTTACGFGFLAGGCNMITAYPMSPSTGVLNFMASMSKEFDIALEQSEDEIASLMMTLGGWYGGARAMTSTSGGGFALMGEALSLSGMTETPAVIYLAQRPGPATGLPTRTEQGDLNLALYSGHGPFPRVLLAPGSLQECIDYGYLAFELADKYQIPVIFLSDQYLADTIMMSKDVDFSSYEQRRYITKSAGDYERYADTKNGISPRAIPSFGEGLICAVGDEHDERGQITEDYKMREQMVGKRARKNDELTREAIAPLCKGEGDIAIIGWGSSKGAIAEALERLDDKRLEHVHFVWIHPLSKEQLSVLDDYKYRIVVENNADGAFADQLKLHGVHVDEQILQSNGFSFFVDQLVEMIEKSLKELS
ncbi:MAG: 2-oxoacid:acceptor oxidoreductase subunit alpha [Thiovulaceae bacterium]|nr:2-oxoacid:acceptor oxidoreductase subunit alpha [Sulfurimonadaceae bacterium]